MRGSRKTSTASAVQDARAIERRIEARKEEIARDLVNLETSELSSAEWRASAATALRARLDELDRLLSFLRDPEALGSERQLGLAGGGR